VHKFSHVAVSPDLEGRSCFCTPRAAILRADRDGPWTARTQLTTESVDLQQLLLHSRGADCVSSLRFRRELVLAHAGQALRLIEPVGAENSVSLQIGSFAEGD
jgi:hypothetical protein